MDDLIEGKIVELIGRVARPKMPITGTTSVNLELNIDGDDAYELLSSIKNEFEIDFENFAFYNFFNDEGALPLFSFLRKKKQSLTVQMLIDAAKQKKWSK